MVLEKHEEASHVNNPLIFSRPLTRAYIELSHKCFPSKTSLVEEKWVTERPTYRTGRHQHAKESPALDVNRVTTIQEWQADRTSASSNAQHIVKLWTITRKR